MTVGPTLERGSGWTVLDTQRSLCMQTKTAHHHSCGPRCFAPHVALTRPPLSRFALHFARPNGYLDSGFLVRICTTWQQPVCLHNRFVSIRAKFCWQSIRTVSVRGAQVYKVVRNGRLSGGRLLHFLIKIHLRRKPSLTYPDCPISNGLSPYLFVLKTKKSKL